MRKGDALSNSQGRLHSMGCAVNNQENMSRSDEWAPTLVLTQGEALSCHSVKGIACSASDGHCGSACDCTRSVQGYSTHTLGVD